MKSIFRTTLLAACIAASGTAVFAETPDEVLGNLKRLYPQTTFKSVKPTPIDGIFEVVMGRNVTYVESTGRYFLFGRLFDMPVQKDLTESVMAEAKKVAFGDLPLKDAIKTVKGNGKRTLVVFSDPDCPFCKQLEQTLALINNVTIYTFLIPLDQLHPDARRKAEAIWCSPDRSQAWKAALLDGKVPATTAGCETPIERNLALAKSVHSLATPILVNVKGAVEPGALPLARLEAFINPDAEVSLK